MKKICKSIRSKRYTAKVLMVLILCILTLNSCKKFLNVDSPKDSATIEQVFENDVIATSPIIGIYNRMVASGAYSGDFNAIATTNGLSSDEFKSYNSTLSDFYLNQIPSNNGTLNSLWNNSYAYIYTANAVLQGLGVKNGVTSGAKKQLQGEAKFTRAFCYFYLVNLFGEVPLHLTTDYRVNNIAKKSSVEQVYSQIIQDLEDAEDLLSDNYITVERIRPNQFTAKALLARVYLYNQRWDLAEQKAEEVVSKTSLYTLENDLNRVFLKNSSEAIWQLMPPTGSNTKEGNLLVLTSTPVYVSLSESILSVFDAGDNRKSKWISQFTNSAGTFYYPFKYKIKSSAIITEYSMVIRLAEIYLIRAEARVRQGKLLGGLEDINLIRKRAGLINPLMGLNQDQCLSEIEKQRRLELFSEWGHRWLDLKRTGKASSVLTPLKGASWQNTDVLYPIPVSETNANPNISQNQGY